MSGEFRVMTKGVIALRKAMREKDLGNPLEIKISKNAYNKIIEDYFNSSCPSVGKASEIVSFKIANVEIIPIVPEGL